MGHEQEQLPEGTETVKLEGKTYYYEEGSFWQQAAGGGYVVVKAPAGAEVSSIPEDASPTTEAHSTRSVCAMA